MRVVARKTLTRFVESLVGKKEQRPVKAALDALFHEVRVASWRTPADVKRAYRSARIVGNDRVVFNIKGNDYRLVVAIDYGRQAVFIKWLGSHSAYDKIDAKTIRYEDQADSNRKRP